MFGFVSKKKLLRCMTELSVSSKKENNNVRYPPSNAKEESMNVFFEGYEEGSKNFYNGLYSRLFK